MNPPPAHSQNDIVQTLGLAAAGKRKTQRRRRTIWILALAALLAIGLLSQTRRRGETLRYVTEPARRGNLVVTVSATGTLAPIKKVDVGIEVSGTIKTVEVDYNDKVKVGQVLARLDTTRLEAQVLQSKAALESTQARILQAQATVQEAQTKWTQLNRVRELSGGKMPAQSDLDAAQATLARAQADEASARAQAVQAQATLDAHADDLSKAVIHSPIDGIVLNRSVEPGQTVAASFNAPVLFTLAEDLKQMELLVDVDEADVGAVQDGQDAVFTVDAYPDREFPAQITQVRYASETVEGVVTYKAELRVDNTELLLRPGMTATAIIIVKKIENALLVPNAALRFTPPEPAHKQKRGGSLVSSLLPRPPRHESGVNASGNDNHKTQKVWILIHNQLAPIAITKGTSDGLMTEVLAGELEPGVELVTDTEVIKQ